MPRLTHFNSSLSSKHLPTRTLEVLQEVHQSLVRENF